MELLESIFGSSSDGIDALGVLSYVLLALGLYAIAQRRCIRKPWLAWIPVANMWLLGCISDQYQYLVHGQQKSKRKTLLIFEILTLVLSMITAILAVVLVLCVADNLALGTDYEVIFEDPELLAESLVLTPGLLDSILGLSLAIVAFALPLAGCGITLMVLQFMAYKDIFASCDLKNKTVYTVVGIVLSILGAGFVLSIFVFLCRNKDEGMPPRKDAEVSVIEAVPAQTGETAEE